MDRFGHGGSSASGQSILDFSANINPFGPPNWLKDCLIDAIPEVSLYPEPYAAGLIRAATKAYNLPEASIAAGNGSTEHLFLLARIYPGRRAIIPVPSYVDYERACLLAGLKISFLPLKADEGFQLSFSRLERRLTQPALVILGQPNNPTGQVFDVEALVALARKNPSSWFVVDEAFADFVPELARCHRFNLPNIVVLASLTKFFALPGLRLGLTFASKSMIRAIHRHQPPWSVNVLAQRAGEQALKDGEYRRGTLSLITQLRQGMNQVLADIPGVTVLPSTANYVLCRLELPGRTAEWLNHELDKQNIAIRDCANYRGLGPEYFRVAVRTKAENGKLVKALTEVLGERAGLS